MELIELRIKRNTYGAVIDGIEPGKLGGLVTFRTTETGTPSVTMVALKEKQIADVLAAVADGTEEAATRMMAGITADGIRSAVEQTEREDGAGGTSAAANNTAIDKIDAAFKDAQHRDCGA